MTEQQKPTNGAMKLAGRFLSDSLLGGETLRDAKLAWAKEIDREAVAPAVRELVEALAKCPQYIICAHNDAEKAGIAEATLKLARKDLEAVSDVLARYRHLLETE